ncbi:MAG: sigma 54-interacting transcriptional regulator [Bacteroidota bacterium]|nr:sigma 54-interacting transcriptional regulator [Candidatus Kapabacteria bacterium]MDW8220778.1 sigma 54-interacting transcriptional regulator [Bacteroidota bacterium]
MTHTLSFTTPRYTCLQTLQLTEYTHLLRALDNERQEIVLLRVFRTHNEAEQSFILTEAAALAKLDVPQIATLYDINITAQHEPYIAFENLQYIPLETIPRTHVHSFAYVIRIVESLLTALAPLHTQMRAICCISPSSIRLADEHTPNVRIALDQWYPLFSDEIVRSVYGAHNRYAAPELASYYIPDARADLYSIGASLYEALTGQSFDQLATVDSPGIIEHLISEALRFYVPDLPDAFVQWMYGLIEHDRSKRFFSAHEALEYLKTHHLLATSESSVPNVSSVSLLPINIIGMESARAAVVNIQSPFVESPVLEISGEPGLGKTMLLRSLTQSRLQSPTLQRYKIVSAPAYQAHVLTDAIAEACHKHEPTLILVDDAEQIPEETRLRIRGLLSQEESLLTGIRLIATHRSQLPLFAAKPTMLTLAHFAPSHIPLFCEEILGRCAFTPEFYRYLYAYTKGHPVTLTLVLRSFARNGTIQRQNRIWTHTDIPSLPDSGAVSPSTAAIESLRLVSSDILSTLAAITAALRASTQAHQRFPHVPHHILLPSLHLIAELLDTSTQHVLRTLLPLLFDGYITLRNSLLEWSHELFREAALSVLEQASIERFEQLTYDILMTRIRSCTPAITQSHATITEHSLSSPYHDNEKRYLPRSAHVAAHSAHGVSPASEPQVILIQHQSKDDEYPAVMLGTSPAVELLRKNLAIAASQDTPCLLESVYGSDREDIAHWIHMHSARKNCSFHAISCADFTTEEFELYLFGTDTRSGLLADAIDGTILLDDIEHLALPLQQRLARFIHTQRKSAKALHPIYSAVSNVRLLLGFTIHNNVRADKAMRASTLATELFFAMSGMRVVVPSLAERHDDIPEIAQAFARSIAGEYGIRFVPDDIPSSFWQQFATKQWIADVAELEADVRTLVLQFNPCHVAESLERLNDALFSRTPSSTTDTTSSDATATAISTSTAHDHSISQQEILSIDDAQKAHILRALAITGGNKTKAAQILKIKRTTLLARMKKFGLMP